MLTIFQIIKKNIYTVYIYFFINKNVKKMYILNSSKNHGTNYFQYFCQ
jgi:hypothetical protein